MRAADHRVQDDLEVVWDVECHRVDRRVERSRRLLLAQSSDELQAELDPGRLHLAAFARRATVRHRRVETIELLALLVGRLTLDALDGI